MILVKPGDIPSQPSDPQVSKDYLKLLDKFHDFAKHYQWYTNKDFKKAEHADRHAYCKIFFIFESMLIVFRRQKLQHAMPISTVSRLEM
jgi:hypothetical protein